jgi:hypothetical protein
MWKVLHLLDHSLPEHSGYAFRTASILREQRRLGWQTSQITSAKQSPLAADSVAGDLYFHRTPPGRFWGAKLPVVDQLDVIRGLTVSAGKLIREFSPDILHAHSPVLVGVLRGKTQP